ASGRIPAVPQRVCTRGRIVPAMPPPRGARARLRSLDVLLLGLPGLTQSDAGLTRPDAGLTRPDPPKRSRPTAVAVEATASAAGIAGSLATTPRDHHPPAASTRRPPREPLTCSSSR